MDQTMLSVAEQVDKALDGRTQRWLALKAQIPETELSRKMNGKVDFTEEELKKINELLEVDIKFIN